MKAGALGAGVLVALAGQWSAERETPPFVRDWARFPAVVDRTTTEQIVALGDVHGAYGRLVPLLERAGLLRSEPGGPEKQVWTGGRRLLVCTGDVINKGRRSIEVLELLMSLQAQAGAAGGEVIVTLGNHEAEFLGSAASGKGKEFHEELRTHGVDPREVVAGRHRYGEWLLNRPIAARVNGWFFAHAGNARGATLDEIAERFRRAVDDGRWRSRLLAGPDSLLEAEKWWRDGKAVERSLRALGVRHIVFGHDPGAAREKGRIDVRDRGRLFVVDVGMSPEVDYSEGAVLLIDREGHEDVATSLEASGRRRPLWRGAGGAEAAAPSG